GGCPFVQEIELIETVLDGDELRVDVGLERHEQKTGVGDRIVYWPIVVVVRAPKDALLLALGSRTHDMRKLGDDRKTGARRCRKVWLVELRRVADGRARQRRTVR